MRVYRPDPKGMRHLIRCALLAAFANRSHGTVPEVESQITATGYNPKTMNVQIAQVRKELMAELRIGPAKVTGRLTNDQKAGIVRQLAHKRVQTKVAVLTTKAGKAFRKAA